MRTDKPGGAGDDDAQTTSLRVYILKPRAAAKPAGWCAGIRSVYFPLRAIAMIDTEGQGIARSIPRQSHTMRSKIQS
jgi:hypothetical protein